jgi:hypothetical protein
MHFKVNKITPTVLTRPKKWKETLAILNQLCKEDIVNLCMLQSWSLPSYYPLSFPHHLRSGRVGGVPVIEEMTASRFSAPLLKRLLETAEEVRLPKYIIVKDEETGQVAYLPPTVLTPTSDFSFTESSDCFLVRKSAKTPSNDITEDADDSISELFSDESDDEEVLYSFFGLASHPQNESDSETSHDLPSPGYTQHGQAFDFSTATEAASVGEGALTGGGTSSEDRRQSGLEGDSEDRLREVSGGANDEEVTIADCEDEATSVHGEVGAGEDGLGCDQGEGDSRGGNSEGGGDGGVGQGGGRGAPVGGGRGSGGGGRGSGGGGRGSGGGGGEPGGGGGGPGGGGGGPGGSGGSGGGGGGGRGRRGDGDGRGDSNGGEDGQGNTGNPQLEQVILNLLPKDFDPGVDGMGAGSDKQRQAASYFREPWKFCNADIQTLLDSRKNSFSIELLHVWGHR